MELRTIRPHERDAVLDLLAEWLEDREFFARYFRYDPTLRDDLCFVAVDAGRLVSTLQVFRKDIRVDGAVLSVGAVANVFTTESYRERGIAAQLLELASSAMSDHSFDLSALFATRLNFYGRLGWSSHLRYFEFVSAPADGCSSVPASSALEFRRFEFADLDAVMSLYDEFNRQSPGSTVRTRDYWVGQLQYAGNPSEHFLTAWRADRLVAYVRATSLYDLQVVMEHGYRAGEADALVTLLLKVLELTTEPGMLTQLATDASVRARIQACGLGCHRVDDYFWMWRVVSPTKVQEKLGLRPNEVGAQDFFQRILPPDRSVYWLSDRF